MTRLTDGKRTICVRMIGINGAEWSADFYAVGTLPYDDVKDAHIVNDVEYCIEQGMDCENNNGDFYEPDRGWETTFEYWDED